MVIDPINTKKFTRMWVGFQQHIDLLFGSSLWPLWAALMLPLSPNWKDFVGTMPCDSLHDCALLLFLDKKRGNISPLVQWKVPFLSVNHTFFNQWELRCYVFHYVNLPTFLLLAQQVFSARINYVPFNVFIAFKFMILIINSLF